MKKKLNILCALVFLTLGFVLFHTGYQFGVSLKMGINATRQMPVQEGEKNFALNGDFRNVSLMPLFIMNYPDTVYNQKTGETLPVAYTSLMVRLQDRKSMFYLTLSFICTVINIVALVWVLVLFIRLVISINRSEIFNWKNVRRLRGMGYLLIAIFVCGVLPAFINFLEVKASFALAGYAVYGGNIVHFTDLFLGIGCLIVAEVFAIGLRMKEEQALTI